MFSVRPLFSLVLFGAMTCGPLPASAAFLFCNQTKAVVEAAFGSREGGTWISEGWWQIQPGQCARVMNKPLSQRFYFYYARELSVSGKNASAPMIWSGKYGFCTDSKAFKIEGDAGCEERGYRRQGFQDVDVGLRQKDYTLTFRDHHG